MNVPADLILIIKTMKPLLISEGDRFNKLFQLSVFLDRNSIALLSINQAKLLPEPGRTFLY